MEQNDSLKKEAKEVVHLTDIVMVSVDNVVPYPRNAKVHTEEQIKKIAQSMQDVGNYNHVVLDEDNVVIAGHGRLAAHKYLKHETIPVIYNKGLPEEVKKRARLADNLLGETGWTEELVKEARELMDDGLDIDRMFPDLKSANDVLRKIQDSSLKDINKYDDLTGDAGTNQRPFLIFYFEGQDEFDMVNEFFAMEKATEPDSNKLIDIVLKARKE